MNDFNPTDIERLMGEAIRDLGVSENVFPNRPRSSNLNLKDFVVCRVSGGVSDLAALGRCVVSVSLFAQDVANVKNGKKLSVMQRKLEGIPLWIEPLLIKGTPTILGDTSDGNGYHARIINFKVFIKAV